MGRYEAYKDSGVEWIGEIPAGWEVRRIKTGVLRKSESGHPDETVLSLYRDYGVVVKDSRDDNFNKTSENTEAYRFVEPNNLVVNKMKAWQGSLAVSEHRGIVSPAYYVYSIVDKVIHPRYMHYQLRDSSYLPEYRRLSGGVRPGQWDLSNENFVNIPMLLPPIEQQQRIAEYLDQKTAEIDVLVEDCEREVELLQEYRKAIISEAITKGLDPNAPMKDSGIEWIGEMPQRWKAEKAKYHLSLVNGRAYKQEELLDEGKYRVLRVGNFNTNENWYYSDLELDEKQYCEKGDLLYLWATTFGPQFWQGEKVIFHYHIWKVILKGSLTKRFAFYAFDAQAFWQELQSHGSTMVHVTKEGMEQSGLPIPSIDEQDAIADYLDAKTAEIDSLIEAKQQMTDRLREYRKSLVSEAVNGKFKIPGVE